MTEVGVRELKTHASKLLDEVQQHGARYLITRRGRPVGLLLPIEKEFGPEAPRDGASSWDELDRLGEEIGRAWSSAKTSSEILSEVRR